MTTVVLEKCPSKIEDASASGLSTCTLYVEEYFDCGNLPGHGPARTGIAAYMLGTGGLDSRTVHRNAVGLHL